MTGDADDTSMRYHGFCDKAAYAASCKVKPKKYRPANKNACQKFYSPVLIFGAIEEKRKPGDKKFSFKESMAQLAAQMQGFVEAASNVQVVHFTSFPGLLIQMNDVGGSTRFTAWCVLWSIHESGRSMRAVSEHLKTPQEFCSGVEWWFEQCEKLLDQALQSSNQVREALGIIPEEDFPLASQSPDQDASDGGSGGKMDTGAASAPNITSSHTLTTTSLQRLENQQRHIFTKANNVDNWVSACVSRHQAGMA